MNQYNSQLLQRLVVLDTETGGLDAAQHSILTLGLVSWDGAHQIELLIAEPTFHTNPRSMEVNKIDLDQVRREGLSPSEACDALEAFLSKISGPRPLLVAGHNISFDLSFIRRLYRIAERPLPEAFSHRSVDTHTLLWALVSMGRLPDEARSSDGAFRYFDVAPSPELRHTALGDAIATRALLEKLLEMFSVEGPLHALESIS